MPRYVYSLHWWEFHQWRPLVQVFAVALFDEEEIHEDLHLLIAESPDELQTVVYGEVRSVKEDHSHQCYVTVCAAPSPHPCPLCKYTALGGITERCLKHSFVVHFKYDLLPPFPIFNPSTNLKMDDTVLFNTGDFLMALRILTIENTNNKFSEVLKSLYPDTEDKASKKSCCFVDNKQDSGGVTGKGDIPCQCAAIGVLERPALSPEGIDVKSCGKVDGIASSEADANQDSSLGNKAKSMQSACSLHKHADRHTIISGFVDVLNQIRGEQWHGKINVNKEECLPPAMNTGSQRECRDSTGNHDCNSTKECDERGNLEKFDVNIDHHPSDLAQTSKSALNSCSDLHNAGNSAHINVSEDDPNILQNGAEQSARNKFQESDHSRCDLDFPDKVSHICSSCGCAVSGPVLNNNNLTSSVFKVYIESSNDPDYHELPDLTGEFDMFDGSLPLTVKTCHGSSLKQVFKLNESNPNTSANSCLEENLGSKMLHALAVQQVTLDLEQCINELILSHEGLQHSYKSLKDYDVQVVGVCPDSGEVITMARLLVYTRTRQPSESFGLPVSPSPVLQCTGFIFSWHVRSGLVRILQVLDLENYPERTRYSKFNMAAKEASQLRAKFSIPQSISSFVQAFSNHTVFTGKSLKYLRHPFLPLVIVL